jgi:Putative MetA-pathway of phenol degradation
MKRIILFSVLVGAFLTSSRGEEPSPEDKSHYTLFNPTPSDSMRGWRTDHAGVSPYTLDAGHFEVDLTPLTYGYDERDVLIVNNAITVFTRLQIRTEAWSYGAITAKVGLANRLDAEVAFVPYETVTSEPERRVFNDNGRPVFPRTTRSGFSDVFSRLKLNLWGNDNGKTALSVSGNVKFPTASDGLGNGQFEGGPSLEFAAQLPWGFELRVDGAVNFFEDDREHRQASIESLMSFSHQIVGDLAGYFMFDTVAFTTGDDWLGRVKAGLNYRMAKNVELYVGNSFGVTDNAFDYEPL